jgi:hypothetical protein
VGLRLIILGWWTPNFILRKELENISDKTTCALKALICKYSAKPVDAANPNQQPLRNIQDQRAAMAQTQSKLVETLETLIGHEETVKQGRETLFLVGQNLGKQARSRLGVGDSQNDLTRAARILYRVLGIEFHLQWHNQSSATVIIDKCALAQQYSKLTCEVLSATDEGVIKGLHPNLTMNFKEYMTSGCNNCRAEINLNGTETLD